MSHKATTWVMYESTCTDPTQLLILWALADRADDDGRNAWPAQSSLAERARCSDRTVRRHLQLLEAEGRISRGDQELVSHLPADRRPVVWDVNMTPGTTAGQNDRPDTGDQNGRTTVSDKPSITSYGSKTVQGAQQRASKRATQITQSGFEVTEDMRAWAADNTPAVDVDRERDVFVDYWDGVGKPMKNWGATWRNWMRRAQERAAGPVVPAEAPVQALTKEQWCEQHGITAAEWDAHDGDDVWKRDVIAGKMVNRRG